MAKYTSKGTHLQIDISGTYTTIAQVTSVSLPDGKIQFTDTTALDSTVVEDFSPTGLQTLGSIQADIFYDPGSSTHTLLHTVQGTQAEQDFKIVHTASSLSAAFSGYVESFVPQFKVGDYMKGQLTIKASSTITFT